MLDTKENKRMFEVKLENDPAKKIELEKMQEEIGKAVETKLEEKGAKLQEDVKAAIKTELEKNLEEKFDQHKKEVIELQKTATAAADVPSEIEKVQLQRLNSCVKEGSEPITLEQLREYMNNLNSQVRNAVRGGDVKLDATIAGFAGFDDARGGALIIPEIDKTIRQDFIDYDEGLFNSINFEPAMSRTKKVVVDTVEPDENTTAVKETLETIGYTLDDGCFVSATLNLKDYDTPARVTYDQIEDEAFRIENYINGKLVQGCRRGVAKDLWIGNSAERIKGIINYPKGNGYGKVGVKHVKTSGKVTMDDIMALCNANKNKGVLFIDKATWGTVITEKDGNGRYKFELGYVQRDMAGARPFHVDAYVPLLGVPVVFDDAFTLPEAVAANVVAAILPPSAVAGYKQPTGRLRVKDDLRYREMLLTERYDAVVRQFKYVRLLLGTQA